MTALDFPAAPTNGQTYEGYVYDSTRGVWNVNVSQVAARFIVSSTQPSSPQNGDAWFDTTEGTTYVYFIDVDSGQWVETGNPALGFIDVANITDVDLTSLADGDILVYDSGTQTWVNGAATTTLAELSDTTIYDPVTNQVLLYDGVEWVNDTLVIPEPISPFLLGGM
jgi:hypothetical protein